MLKLFIAALGAFFIFTPVVFSADYDFNIDEQTAADKKKNNGNIKAETEVDQAKPAQTKPAKKDSVSSADVFELFKGEQKVAIVSKKEERIQDAPATVYVVTDREIKERGYMFLHDLMRDVPGFDFINDLGNYGMLAMQRGIDTPENNKTLIFINGVATNNPSQGVSYMSYQFALHNVKRVEILWGPASALYGANAFTGIINIVTKSAADLEAEGKLGHASVGAMSFQKKSLVDGTYFDFMAGSKLWDSPEAGTITLAGHYIRSDNGPMYGERQTNFDASKKNDYYVSDKNSGMPLLGDYNISAQFDFKGLSVGARAWYFWTKQGAFATYNYSATELAYWGHQGQDFFAKYTHKWNEAISTFSQVTFRASQLPEGQPGQRPFDADRNAYGEDTPGTLLWYRRNDFALSTDQQVTYTGKGNSVTSAGFFGEWAKVSNWNTNDTSLTKWDGVNFANKRYPTEVKGSFDGQENIISEGIGPVKDKPELLYDQYNLALYGQHNMTLLEKFQLTLGGRGDMLILKGIEGPEVLGTSSQCSAPCTQVNPIYTDASAGAAGAQLKRSSVYYLANPVSITTFSFNPRAGLVYHPTKNQTLKLLHGWAFRNPTVRERFSLSGSRIPVGTNLKPEQIKTTELGYSIKPLPFLQTEIDGFWSEVTDVIQLSQSTVGKPGAATEMTQFQNVGNARLLGFELKADIVVLQTNPLNIFLFTNYSFQSNNYTSVSTAGQNSLSHDLSSSDINASSNSMPRVSTHKANLGLTFSFYRNLAITPVYHFVGERPNVITSPIASVPAYHLFNLSMSYNNPKKDWEFSLYVFNLFDQEINDPGTRDAKGDYYSPVRPIGRISFWAKLTYKL